MTQPTFSELIGAVMTLGAGIVVAYIAVSSKGEPATLALGGLLGAFAAGVGFFLRARVQAPNGEPPHG